MQIDTAVEAFCSKLNDACGAENERAFEAWSASNRVDNPGAAGMSGRMGLPGAMPNRTFRYGMPDFKAPRPKLAFRVSPNKSSSFRTPQEQAAEVIVPIGKSSAKSYVCWGAHMSNMARHILPSIDGKEFTDGDAFERALGTHLSWFVAIWTASMQACGLRDAGGGVSWFKTPHFNDQLHVELLGAKVPQSDPRATACVLEYVRLVNAKVGKRNKTFESRCGPSLSPHLSKITVP